VIDIFNMIITENKINLKCLKSIIYYHLIIIFRNKCPNLSMNLPREYNRDSKLPAYM